MLKCRRDWMGSTCSWTALLSGRHHSERRSVPACVAPWLSAMSRSVTAFSRDGVELRQRRPPHLRAGQTCDACWATMPLLNGCVGPMPAWSKWQSRQSAPTLELASWRACLTAACGSHAHNPGSLPCRPGVPHAGAAVAAAATPGPGCLGLLAALACPCQRSSGQQSCCQARGNGPCCIRCSRLPSASGHGCPTPAA